MEDILDLKYNIGKEEISLTVRRGRSATHHTVCLAAHVPISFDYASLRRLRPS